MLSERQLQAALKLFDERMQALNEEYLRMMGEHIRSLGKLTASDIHRTVQMKRLNANVEAIKRKIARAMDANIRDVEQVFLAAAESDARFAAAIFGETHSPSVKGNKPLERILKAQLRLTGQTMQNLSRTTILSEPYRKAVDVGVSAVQTGLTDYNSAVRRAMREAAGEGLRVKYPNSGLTRRLDTAVRQNILDGVRSINQDVLNQLGKEFGADGVEISAHALCAEDHLPYQGRQFSNKEFADLQNSLDRQIGAWNCKHTVHPILLGISPPAYSDAELDAFRQNNREEIEIDGTTLTRYEWTQEQRRLETQVRCQKDIAVAAKASGDDVLRREAQAKINDLTRQYEKVSEKAGLIEQRERMSVSGFRRVKAFGELKDPRLLQKLQNHAKIASRGDTMAQIGSPIEQRNTGKGKPSAILHYERPLNNRQSRLLEQLGEFNSRAIVNKRDVNMRDLAALTAETGDEFAMFTRKSERLIIRGNERMTNVDPETAKRMCEEGWRWSGHTHPGADSLSILPSDGDYLILAQFTQQEYSVIYNVVGEYLVFGGR